MDYGLIASIMFANFLTTAFVWGGIRSILEHREKGRGGESGFTYGLIIVPILFFLLFTFAAQSTP